MQIRESEHAERLKPKSLNRIDRQAISPYSSSVQALHPQKTHMLHGLHSHQASQCMQDNTFATSATAFAQCGVHAWNQSCGQLSHLQTSRPLGHKGVCGVHAHTRVTEWQCGATVQHTHPRNVACSCFSPSLKKATIQLYLPPIASLCCALMHMYMYTGSIRTQGAHQGCPLPP